MLRLQKLGFEQNHELENIYTMKGRKYKNTKFNSTRKRMRFLLFFALLLFRVFVVILFF